MVNAAITALEYAASHLARLAPGGNKPPRITKELGSSTYRELTPKEIDRLLEEVTAVRDRATRTIRLLRKRRKSGGMRFLQR